MPIKVACQCGAKFNVKEQLAGKTVKCPKCSQPLKIPAANLGSSPSPSTQLQPRQTTSPAPAAGGLGSLLDEAGVGAKPVSGPKCPACGVAVQPGAVICVECGFNSQTGERMQTFVAEDPDAHLSEGERLVAKVERERMENPDINEGGYGDEGVAAYLVTFFMMIVAVVFVVVVSAIGVYVSPVVMLVLGGIALVVGRIWILVLAFMDSPVQGLLCFFFDPYSVIYAIMKFGDAKIPVMLYLVGILSIVAAYVMLSMEEAENQVGHLVNYAMMFC